MPESATQERRPCPACAELILIAAKKCRYCGTDIAAEHVAPSDPETIRMALDYKNHMREMGVRNGLEQAPASKQPGTSKGDSRPGPSKTEVTLIKVGFAVIACICISIAVCGSQNNRRPAETVSRRSQNDEPKQEIAPTERAPDPPTPRMSVGELASEYEANEVGADKRYSGKWLVVSGVVAAIERRDGRAAITLRSAVGRGRALAVFRVSAAERAGAVRRGQSVTVECQVEGTVQGSPYLGTCSFAD